MNPGKYASHRTPEESFAARTEWQGDCIVWTGHRYGIGYGSIWVDSKNVPLTDTRGSERMGQSPRTCLLTTSATTRLVSTLNTFESQLHRRTTLTCLAQIKAMESRAYETFTGCTRNGVYQLSKMAKPTSLDTLKT